jgi:hypothetical protein
MITTPTNTSSITMQFAFIRFLPPCSACLFYAIFLVHAFVRRSAEPRTHQAASSCRRHHWLSVEIIVYRRRRRIAISPLLSAPKPQSISIQCEKTRLLFHVGALDVSLFQRVV